MPPAERPLAEFDSSAFAGEGVEAAAPADDQFSWRPSGYLSPVRAQGTANSCTSFAIAAAVEFQWRRAHPPVRLAPGFIHRCLGGLDDLLGYDPSQAAGDCVAHGIVRGFSNDYPYPPQQCGRIDRVAVRSWQWLRSTAEALDWIGANGPVVADLRIDRPSFLHLSPQSVYDPPASADFLHTVLVVGYNFSQGWALIQNSFGPSWCDGGFGRIRIGAGGGFMAARGALFLTV